LTRLDPDGTQRRARAARDQADLALYEADHGMGDVAIHAPIEDAVTIKTAVDAYAATAKAAGDPRPIGVLRAEAPAKWASDYLTGTTSSGSAPRAGGRPIEIAITLPLRTALALDDLPGELPGFGIVPREVIAAMIRTELPKLRLMVIDPDLGRLLYRAESFKKAASEMPCGGALARTCSSVATSTARATHTDHVIAHPVGPTQIGNLLPFDRTWHRGKTKSEVKVRVDNQGQVYLTTASGQSRTVTPYDYRMTDTPATDPGNMAEGADQ
jgi:hypothetical protein